MLSILDYALRSWLSDMDLNHDNVLQRDVCYHYTIGQPAPKLTVYAACANKNCPATGDSVKRRMPKNYWLVKQEPESYSWDTFVKEKRTTWSGVRNFQARNYLRQMAKGDLVV